VAPDSVSALKLINVVLIIECTDAGRASSPPRPRSKSGRDRGTKRKRPGWPERPRLQHEMDPLERNESVRRDRQSLSDPSECNDYRSVSIARRHASLERIPHVPVHGYREDNLCTSFCSRFDSCDASAWHQTKTASRASSITLPDRNLILTSTRLQSETRNPQPRPIES
jgi:hypothetical protein